MEIAQLEALNAGLLNLMKGFLKQTMALSEADFTALLNADGTEVNNNALSTLIQKDAARVSELTGTSETLLQERLDEGYRKGAVALENKIKAKYKSTSSKTGVELIDEIVTSAKGGTAKITEEQVTNHRLYVDLKESVDSQINAAVAAEKQTFEAKEKTWNREKVLDQVKSDALKIFNGMNPVLSSNEKKAEKQLKMLIGDLEAFDYLIEGDRIVVMKDGNVVKNQHGHRLDFNAHVEGIANDYYDFDTSGNRQEPPPPGGVPPGPGARKTVLKKPKDDQEFVEQYGKIESDSTLTKDAKHILLQELTKLHKEPASA